MAEEDPESTSEPTEAGSGGRLHEHPLDLEEARTCLGAKLDELGGATVGRIDGLLVDALDDSPTWFVVRHGRFGRRTAIPFDLAAPGVGRVWVPLSREAIRSGPELDPGRGLSCADERELATHFGVPEDSGRHATIAGRDDDDPGSVPA